MAKNNRPVDMNPFSVEVSTESYLFEEVFSKPSQL